MSRYNPLHLIIIGGILMLLGVIFPFLMVMQVLRSTIFLNFFSYIASFIGMFLGMYGVFTYIKINRDRP